MLHVCMLLDGPNREGPRRPVLGIVSQSAALDDRPDGDSRRIDD
jgi:hypothetical protein